jgi:hypothetical protein
VSVADPLVAVNGPRPPAPYARVESKTGVALGSRRFRLAIAHRRGVRFRSHENKNQLCDGIITATGERKLCRPSFPGIVGRLLAPEEKQDRKRSRSCWLRKSADGHGIYAGLVGRLLASQFPEWARFVLLDGPYMERPYGRRSPTRPTLTGRA